MPKPSPDFDLITVEWRAANDRGEAQVGSLRIAPNISRALVDPHASTPIGVYLTPRTVTISPTQVTIDSVMYNVGYASFQLVASNDPDIFADSSEWFTYTITETLTNGAEGETYNLFVDKDAVGGTINLQAVDRGIPASTSSSPVSTVTVSAFATLTGRVDDLEAGSAGSVPTGGTTGQVLAKASGTNYDMAWTDGLQGPAGPAGQGVPAGGTTGQVLAKVNGTDYNTAWTDGVAGPTGPAGADGAPGAAGADGADGQGVPTGGTAGQVLAKASGTNFDTEWADLAGGSGTKVGDRVMYVAAAAESAGVKAACDYVCDGTADEVQINAALAAVGSESISHGNGTTTANTNGGKVVLVGRNFNISGAILVPTQTRLTSLYGEFGTRISCASSYTPGINGGMIELATANTQYVEIDGFTLDGNNVSTCGVYINVGTGQEYDAYIKVHDIYMWDIGQDGLSVNNQSGGRCRGNHFWSMRMINAGRYSVFVNAPDSFYDRIDSGSAGSHGFYIQHANNRFVNCKSWFSDGSGFYFTTAARDNQLSACESQDNEFHGYHIQGRQNNLAACKADSNSYDGSPSGAITGRSYYGFYINGDYTNVNGTASDKNESSRGLRQVYGVFIASGKVAVCNVTTYQHFTGSYSNAGTLHGHIVGT